MSLAWQALSENYTYIFRSPVKGGTSIGISISTAAGTSAATHFGVGMSDVVSGEEAVMGKS